MVAIVVAESASTLLLLLLPALIVVVIGVDVVVRICVVVETAAEVSISVTITIAIAIPVRVVVVVAVGSEVELWRGAQIGVRRVTAEGGVQAAHVLIDRVVHVGVAVEEASAGGGVFPGAGRGGLGA